jgi:hypothetical protein
VVSSSDDFPFLVESARRFIALLANRPAFDAGSGERGSALVQHIEHTTLGLETQIEQVRAKFEEASSPLEEAVSLKHLRLLTGYAHFMRRALPWLEDAKNPPLELGALYLVDHLSEAMLQEVADVVPTSATEYSTEQQPFAPLFPKLGLRPLPEARRAIILNFPALEAGSFPLLPLFAHELGHTVVTKDHLAATALSRARQNPDFNRLVQAAKSALENAEGLTEERASLIIDERLSYWTIELLCDQLAIQHLGVSYMLAFSVYLVPLTWNAPGPRHPPTTFRISHLLKWMEKTPWEDLLDNRMPVSFAWLKEVAAAPRQKPSAPVSILLDALDIARSELAGVVSKCLGENVYSAHDYLAEARHLDEQLRYEVLPVQHPSRNTPFDPRAILVSGWLTLHEEAARDAGGETPATLCRTLATTDSNPFFTKALELSRVLGVWEKTG